jgi:thiamine biosynthesis protein ThiI
MMIDAVHFHSFPYTGEKAKEKALDLARILTQWKLRHINLFIPFFTHVQETVNKLCPEPTWTLIHRRFMLRIAEKIALQGTDHNFKPYHCIITGDNLGQVASQTIQNIGVVSLATKLPVLRPLIAYDKQEIITKAREIDTLRISTQPHLDCCTIFAPKVPLTKALESEIVQAESALPIEELVRESLDKMEIIKIPYK